MNVPWPSISKILSSAKRFGDEFSRGVVEIWKRDERIKTIGYNKGMVYINIKKFEMNFELDFSNVKSSRS